jgi:thioredoxin reductase (NADPH)
MATDMWDTIVIGAGSAGMAAAIYAARFNMKVLIVGKIVGGLLNESHNVENYPGFKSIPGLDLMAQFKEHVDNLKVPVKEEWTVDVKRHNAEPAYFEVIAEDDAGERHSYYGKTLILTMGTKHKHLNVPGESRLQGRGVSYCATCDAAFYRNVPVAIVGGGDSAAQAGALISGFASRVYIIVRGDKMRAEPINIRRLEQNPKVTILYSTQITEVLGDKLVTGVKLSKQFNGSDVLPLEGVFVEIGHDIQSELAVKLGVAVNDHKEIIIDGESCTNVSGVYAAGDVGNRRYKQALTGAAEGAIAAFSAYAHIQKLESGEDARITYG